MTSHDHKPVTLPLLLHSSWHCDAIAVCVLWLVTHLIYISNICDECRMNEYLCTFRYCWNKIVEELLFSTQHTTKLFFVWGDYWFHLSSVGKVQWTLWKVLWDEVNILWSSTWHHLTLTSQLHRIFINIRTLVKCCQCACVKVFMWNKLIKYPKWMFHLNIFMTNWKQSRNPLELSFTNIALNLGSRF